MQALSRFSVTARLAAIVAIALAALGVIAVNGLFAVRAADVTAVEVIDHELAAVRQLGQARAAVGNLRRYEKDMFLNMGNDDAVDGYVKHWRAEVVKAEAYMKSCEPLLVDAERPQVGTMLGGLANYRKGVEGLIASLAKGEIHDPWAANKAMTPLKGDVRAMDKALDALAEAVTVRVAAEREAIVAKAHRQLVVNGAVVAVATAALAALAWLIGLSITRPLGEAVAVVQRVAAGDLTKDITAQGSDELATLLRQLAVMQDALRRLATEMRDGAANVATASAQIAQGNADLSSRTEQQAASLQQTAASMEQLTGTVRNGADSAGRADVLAQQARDAAVRGGSEVAKVVQTMGEIQSASARIAEINSVIDGIAFQTNILALNAAVEAARAGEQGRGFAVVATEVRTLAQRSADAARQIKVLIGDSVARVEAGSALVQTAGRTIDEVVGQVRHVSELIGEVTGSTREQSQGIEQVGQAVTALDQTTQQNAALVEESAAAAESLKAQAERLASAVSAFRLESKAA